MEGILPRDSRFISLDGEPIRYVLLRWSMRASVLSPCLRRECAQAWVSENLRSVVCRSDCRQLEVKPAKSGGVAAGAAFHLRFTTRSFQRPLFHCLNCAEFANNLTLPPQNVTLSWLFHCKRVAKMTKSKRELYALEFKLEAARLVVGREVSPSSQRRSTLEATTPRESYRTTLCRSGRSS
jgi:hypothetical protein